jgi:hypothetical protein
MSTFSARALETGQARSARRLRAASNGPFAVDGEGTALSFVYFASFFDSHRPDLRVSARELARVADILRTTPQLRRGLIFTPEPTVGRYYPHDGAPPHLALELYFARIDHLEEAIGRNGHLQQLAAPETLPSLVETDATQQAMVARPFPVPDARFRSSLGEMPCTYLVHYPGKAADLNVWHDYYLHHHPQIMAHFPDIREIEISTRVDWCGFLPWPRVDYMQRNKLAFDNAAALIRALESPVRAEMRADYHKFPPFEGANVHYPFATLEIRPDRVQ